MKELVRRIDRLYAQASEKPWAWWNTGDKDNGWQIGLMTLEGGKLVGGDQSADQRGEEDEEPFCIQNICENWGSSSDANLADAALAVELVNAWPQIRAALKLVK